MSNRATCQHCGKVIYFSPRLKKWVTHRVTRPNRDKIIETWKCGNDPANQIAIAIVPVSRSHELLPKNSNNSPRHMISQNNSIVISV
jgi:hypothetical protein